MDFDEINNTPTALRRWSTNPLLARALPFAVYVLFLALESLLLYLQQIEITYVLSWDLRWLYIVKVVCVSLVLWCFWQQYYELTSFREISLGQCAVAIFVGITIFLLWINLDHEWATVGEASGFEPTDGDGQLDVYLVIGRLLGAALVVPLMEELFWRSYLMRWLTAANFTEVKPAKIEIHALVIASVLFASAHTLWFAALLAGLAYGWLYMRTENLWIPVLAHSVTNAMLGAWVLWNGVWQFW